MSGLVLDAITSFLVDTLIWTGALIALVLVVRRPVGRHFGPQIAYGLWALPLLRFLMPPLVLPASMAPEQSAMPAGAIEAMIILPAKNAEAGAASAASAGVLELSEILILVWLAGALVFLLLRARQYQAMRDELLAQARPVGESGHIRLVETPAVTSPVAFGIFDKVVALPPFFMAQLDLTQRDMAIAHELAHHRGHDLVANVAAQPLLALHWFNPLAWWGWRAMRRDQEAACDARVVAGRGRGERAAYAEVIAGFAAGEHLALAAPMACPVLGEKSIVHRLRSLAMSDISSRRRKLGMAALASTALVIPLTATVSYALPEQVQDAADPLAPPPAPEAPLTPIAPEPPVPPAPPEAPEVRRHVIQIELDGEDGGFRRIERHIVMHDGDFDEEAFEAEMERLESELEKLEAGEHRWIEHDVRIARADAQTAREVGRKAGREARAMALSIDVAECEKSSETVIERDLGDGRRAMIVCKKQVLGSALNGIEAAREAIAADKNLSVQQREQILRGLDEAIAEMEAHKSAAFEAASVSRAAQWQLMPVGVLRTVAVSYASPVAVRPVVKVDEDCTDAPERTVSRTI